MIVVWMKEFLRGQESPLGSFLLVRYNRCLKMRERFG